MTPRPRVGSNIEPDALIAAVDGTFRSAGAVPDADAFRAQAEVPRPPARQLLAAFADPVRSPLERVLAAGLSGGAAGSRPRRAIP